MKMFESAYSNEVSALPVSVKGELLQVVNQGEVKLSWEPLEKFFVDGQEFNTTGYELIDEVTGEVLVSVEGGTTAEVLVDTAADGIEKETILYAVDSNAEPVEKLAMTGVNKFRTNPSVPQNLVAEELVGAIKLNWDAITVDEEQNKTATKYFIYRSAQEGTSYQKIGEVDIKEDTVFVDTDLQEDIVYYYVVTSVSEFED